MIANAMDRPPTANARSHAAFYKESTWLMVATIAGGFLSLGVHFLSKVLTESQYSAFVTLLMLVSCVPAIPLQMVFAQQTASALATGRERQLAGMLRLSSLWMFVLWLAASAITLVFQGQIVERWGLAGPVAFWLTLLAVLFSLWAPMYSGALQGRQDFFWLGWSFVLSGVFRFGIAAFLVLAVRQGETGMMAGALVGTAIIVVVGVRQMRDLLWLPKEHFDGKTLLAQVVPLVLGFGATQFLFASDTMFAKPHFSKDEMACYGLAGTLARALLWLVLPLASVMFPKIVHSTARSEKTNLLGVVLIGTAVLAICGTLGLWFLGPWVVRLVSKASYVATTSALLPWYAAAMVPLTLANVLVNDLLARSYFRVVPAIVAVAVAYGLTLPFLLNRFPGRLELPLQTVGVFNLILLAVCALFTWKGKPGHRPAAASSDTRFP